MLWKVDELEKAITVASRDPAYYGLDEVELSRRKNWTGSVRNQVYIWYSILHSILVPPQPTHPHKIASLQWFDDWTLWYFGLSTRYILSIMCCAIAACMASYIMENERQQLGISCYPVPLLQLPSYCFYILDPHLHSESDMFRLVQSGELLKRGRAIQQLQNTRTQTGLTSILPKTMMTSFLQNQIDSSYSWGEFDLLFLMHCANLLVRNTLSIRCYD